MSRTFQVLGVGSPLVDILAQVSEEFVAAIPGEKGGMELVDAETVATLIADLGDSAQRATGGSAANTIFGLAELGIKCSFLGKLGADEPGDFYIAQSTKCGVDDSRFKRTTDMPTGEVCCMVTPDSERTFRTYLGAACTMSLDEISVDDFTCADHVHIEGYMLFNRDLAAKILSCAKEAGCTVSLDLASFEVVGANADILEEILTTKIDMVFANEEEAKAFTGSDDHEANLAALGKFCDVAVVKVGADGAYLKRGNETARVSANKVNAIDTTGAGDLWAAGFLYGHLSGKDLETCGNLGSLLGAEVVQILGADISTERWNQIRKDI